MARCGERRPQTAGTGTGTTTAAVDIAHTSAVLAQRSGTDAAPDTRVVWRVVWCRATTRLIVQDCARRARHAIILFCMEGMVYRFHLELADVD